MGNIIAVAAIGQGQARQLAEVLLDGEQIGQNLAGVKLIREGVDHGDLGIFGKDFQLPLVVGANGNGVQVAGENAGRILQRLAAAHLHRRRHQI
jgi:hypothetical protein